MFIRWYRKGHKTHRLDKVVKVELVSTGDLQVHHLLNSKLVHTTLMRGTSFDFVSIQDEGK